MALLIRWSPKAAQQLEAIVEYIGRDSERYATIFARKILQIVKFIPSYPRAGRVVPEYDDVNLREKIHRGYRIVYRLTPQAIEIVSICHGSRLLKNAMQEAKGKG
jgi:plasmid stabilization system protein ParE